MGQKASTPEPSPRPPPLTLQREPTFIRPFRQPQRPKTTLTDTPWRKFPHKWNEGTVKQLREKVYKYKPIHEQVEHTRIVLMGFVGAGKSSFYNTVNAACRVEMQNRAEAGTSGATGSVTKELKIYSVHSDKNKVLKFCIMDTMGAEIRSGLQPKDIPPLLAGKLPNGYDLSNQKQDPEKHPGYIREPSLTQQPHAVGILANITSVNDAVSDPREDLLTWEKLWSIKDQARTKGIPVLFILTHIDELCEEVAQDVTKVFHSVAVRDAVRNVAAKMGVPENMVLPMQNYREDTYNDINIDILTLENIRYILVQAGGFLEEKLEEPK